MIDLKKIEAAAKDANQTRWQCYHDHGWLVVGSDDEDVHVLISRGSGSNQDIADATHIATANPTPVREMVSMIRERDAQVAQLQEQNTYLDKVASELQDLCDRQAKMLGERDAVLRQALDALEINQANWKEKDKAIEAIKGVLG